MLFEGRRIGALIWRMAAKTRQRARIRQPRNGPRSHEIFAHNPPETRAIKDARLKWLDGPSESLTWAGHRMPLRRLRERPLPICRAIPLSRRITANYMSHMVQWTARSGTCGAVRFHACLPNGTRRGSTRTATPKKYQYRQVRPSAFIRISNIFAIYVASMVRLVLLTALSTIPSMMVITGNHSKLVVPEMCSTVTIISLLQFWCHLFWFQSGGTHLANNSILHIWLVRAAPTITTTLSMHSTMAATGILSN